MVSVYVGPISQNHNLVSQGGLYFTI